VWGVAQNAIAAPHTEGWIRGIEMPCGSKKKKKRKGGKKKK